MIWDEITYPFLNFNVEQDHLHFKGHVISYPW